MANEDQFLKRSRLAEAITAIKAGDLETGRLLLDSELENDPDNINAWLWMSAAVSTDDERRQCLEQVLRINPTHAGALRGIQKLAGGSADSPKANEPVTNVLGTDELAESATAQAVPAPAPPEPEQPAPDLEVPALSADETELSSITWPLEPEQRDLALESPLGQVDVDEYLNSFAVAAAASAGATSPEPELPTFEWRFEQTPKDESGEQPVIPEEPLNGEDSLDRFLGIEPPPDDKRGFYGEEPAHAGEAVPAFIFDDESEEGGEHTAFAFDIDEITSDVPPGASPDLPSQHEIPHLWANPGGRPNSLCILRNEYLVLAHPDPLFIDRIREEAAHGEVKKKSLGRSARAIPLNALQRVTCEPEGSNFEVTYLKGDGSGHTLQATAEFASTDERDEAIAALADQLSPGFKIIEQNTSRMQAILPPVLMLVFTLLAIPLLAFLASWIMQELNLSDAVSLLVWAGIVLLGVLCTVFGLAWLYRRLRIPSELIVIVPTTVAEVE
jgi:hypothetical protein